MPKKTIFRGSVANDGTGDNLRFGAEKINDNFTELYTLLGDGSTLSAGTIVTTTETQTITNKTIDGSNNTITNIPASALAFNSITIGDDTSTNFNVELGGSFEIIGGSGINTAITNNRIELSTDGSIVTESSTDTLTNKTIAAGSNTITGLTNTNLSGTAGITNANLANSHIRIGDDSSTNYNVNLGESFEITGGTGISTAIDNNRIVLTATSIPNSSLTNSSFTLGSDTINLGDTTTSIAGLSLTGSGTIDLTGAGSKARFDFAGFGSLPAFGTYPGMFAFDTVGNRPYYSSGSGWVRLLDENASVSAHTDVNITGIADGYILQWSSGDGRFNAVANSGGATELTVSDDSSTSGTIALATDTLGFVGTNGITTTINPQNKTIESKIASDFYADNYLNASALIDVTNSGSSAYLFNSHYSGNNPTLYLKSGQTYAFKLNSISGHPFFLQTVSGAYSSGNSYTTGLTHVATDGTISTGSDALLKVSGTLYYEVPSGTNTTIYYVCQNHSSMAGSIVIHTNEVAPVGSLTYTNGTAVGDGSTTAFTIDSGRSVNDILVSVNGFLFVPTTDYTVSGTTLTFTTAPASSAEINIRYLPLTGSATYTNDTATGDGSTTGFTIDSGRSVEDVFVSVNGVVLVPSTDYSISGTTLTFVTAPAASAEISIRYLRLT